MNYEKQSKKKKTKHFNPDGIRTCNRPDQRLVFYPLHYKYYLVITDRAFHLTNNNYNKITVCFYKTLRFSKNRFVIDKYLYKQQVGRRFSFIVHFEMFKFLDVL